MTKEAETQIQYWSSLVLKWAASIILCLVGVVGNRAVTTLDKLEVRIDELNKTVNSIDKDQMILRNRVETNTDEIRTLRNRNNGNN